MCASRSYFTNFSELPSPRSSRVHSHEWTPVWRRGRRAERARIYLSCVLLSTFWQSRTILWLLPGLWINQSFSSYETSLLCIPSRNEEHTLYVAPGFTMSLNYRLWYHFVRSYTRETGSIRASTEEIARLDVEAGSLFINWPETRNEAGDVLLERCTSVCTI